MKPSRAQRLSYIIEVAAASDFVDDVGLVSALCRCLAEDQACELLTLHPEASATLREPILRKVRDDIATSFLPVHAKLVSQLIGAIASPSAAPRQSLGYCLSTLLPHLPPAQRTGIISVFLQSKYVGLRRRAYKFLAKSPRLPTALVTRAWEQFPDRECAFLIAGKFPIAFLLKHRAALASHMTEGWQLSKLYLRIGRTKPDLLREFRTRDPISYSYVLAKLGHKLTSKEGCKLVDECSSDERFGLLLWSLGRLGLWESLTYARSRLPDIQRTRTAMLLEEYGI